MTELTTKAEADRRNLIRHHHPCAGTCEGQVLCYETSPEPHDAGLCVMCEVLAGVKTQGEQ